MKLLERTDSAFKFLVGKRERELLLALLQRYPMLSAAQFRRDGTASGGHEELLEEALAETQLENRRNLERMLKEAGRFEEGELGFTFRLSSGELEWLLQVLNDIRVGSWVRLGQPDGKARAAAALSEAGMELAWALEMAGHFQHVLLEAAGS